MVGEDFGGIVDPTGARGAIGGSGVPGISGVFGIAGMPSGKEANEPGCDLVRDVLPERCFNAGIPPVGCLVEANFPGCCLIPPTPPLSAPLA